MSEPLNPTVNEPPDPYDSSFARLIGAFFSPVKTFASIARRPTCALPLILLALAVSAGGYAVHERTDYREVTARALEARGAPEGSVDLDQVAGIQERIGGIFSAAAGPIAILFVLLLALIYMVGFRMLGSELDFKTSLGVLAHGSLPGVLGAALIVPVVLGRTGLSFEELTTRNFLASNLAFLAPDDVSLMVKTALAGVDFFSLWSAVLLYVGYRLAARVSAGTAAAVVAVVWLAGLALRVGLSALQGGGAG